MLTARKHDGILLTKMARGLGVERTSLTRNLNVMVAKGLVTIKTGEDKRERRISITPQGMKVLEEAILCWENVQAEIVESLGLEKWAGLLSDLREVSKKA